MALGLHTRSFDYGSYGNILYGLIARPGRVAQIANKEQDSIFLTIAGDKILHDLVNRSVRS